MANDFLPFSTSGSANVYTNAEYVADTDHTNGNQPGIAKSKLVNKALRQCSIISTVVAQFISDITGSNSVDDGTTATLLANLKLATKGSIGDNIASATTTSVGSDSSGDVIHITGTTTITSLGVSTTGTKKTLIFDGILILSHNATSLILAGGADIATGAGSAGVFVCTNGALGYWKCIGYTDNLTSKESLLNVPNITGGFTLDGATPNYGKNYIINGNFDIWDYGTSGTTTVGVATYTANRWIITSTGVGAPWSKQATDKSGQYGLQVAGTAGLTGVTFIQRIESIMGRRASGKAITIQYKIYSPDSRTITYSSKTADVIDVFSAITQKHTGTFNVVTGWNTGSFTISALDATSYRGFDIEFQCGALTSGNLAIAQMQAEEGSTATSWSPYFGEFGGEVEACARYYHIAYGGFGGPSLSGSNNTGIISANSILRAIPIVTHLSTIFTNGFPSTAPTISTIGKFGFRSVRTASSTLQDGSFIDLFTLSAEL